jgi:hypothetical protein
MSRILVPAIPPPLPLNLLSQLSRYGATFHLAFIGCRHASDTASRSSEYASSSARGFHARRHGQRQYASLVLLCLPCVYHTFVLPDSISMKASQLRVSRKVKSTTTPNINTISSSSVTTSKSASTIRKDAASALQRRKEHINSKLFCTPNFNIDVDVESAKVKLRLLEQLPVQLLLKVVRNLIFMYQVLYMWMMIWNG